MQHFMVKYIGGSAVKNLTNDFNYMATFGISKGGTVLRVKGDDDKWNKYSPKHFRHLLYNRMTEDVIQCIQDSVLNAVATTNLSAHRAYMECTDILTPLLNNAKGYMTQEEIDELVDEVVKLGVTIKKSTPINPAVPQSAPAVTANEIIQVKPSLLEDLKKQVILHHDESLANRAGMLEEILEKAVRAGSISESEAKEKLADGIKALLAEDKKEKATVNVKTKTAKKTLTERLLEQDVPETLLKDLVHYRKEHKLDKTTAPEDLLSRIPRMSTLYQGGEVFTSAISALLEGHNVLFEGPKATGKNVLCDNLATMFGRPKWDISFHVNTDASSLIGSETFKDGEVGFRPGSVYNVAKHGGFAVLDEINMAKNEAIAVLHAVLDDRRVIDVPGYDVIEVDEHARFLGTMNYGYSGTRELNEALVSRFTVIDVQPLDKRGLERLLTIKYPTLNPSVANLLACVFTDLQEKALTGEISTKAVDLRGIINAVGLVNRGIKPSFAMKSCIVNKAFDKYEREIVADVVGTRITDALGFFRKSK